jgi:creatinine amidohydrolase/Fe(II)-dependent formamide hydrolase-like protein
VLGDPTDASAVHGKALFEAMVEHMGEVFAEIAVFELPVDG